MEAYTRRVAQLVDEGKSFVLIERSIDDWPLDEEQRAALWIYAWSLKSSLRNQRKVRSMPRLGTE